MATKYLKRDNQLPECVKDGIKRGQEQARLGKTKSTQEVMAKYEKATECGDGSK